MAHPTLSASKTVAAGQLTQQLLCSYKWRHLVPTRFPEVNTHVAQYLQWFRVSVHVEVSSILNHFLQVVAVRVGLLARRISHYVIRDVLSAKNCSPVSDSPIPQDLGPRFHASTRATAYHQLTSTTVAICACKRIWVRNGNDS